MKTRRSFLKLTGLSGLGLVSGCCVTAPSIPGGAAPLTSGLLAEDPAALLAGPGGIPAIDAHAHFFNASDMNAAGYLAGPIASEAPASLRRLIEILHPVVEQMARNFAPSAFQEVEHLESLDTNLAGLSRADRLERLDQTISERKDRIAEELYRRLRNTDFEEEFRSTMQNGSYLIQGNQEFSEESVRAALDFGLEGSGAFRSTALFDGPDQEHPAGLLAFVGNMFHYRIDNIRIYQKAYADPGNTVRIAAACHALVDFDFWLMGCDHPPSRLADQVLLTEKLVELTDGFILPVMAYNPWADLESDGEQLALLEDAVLNRGFVGAKVYPPVCFEPFGQGGQPQQPGWPTPDELKPWLERFYGKCRDLDIPVMAHANWSMGAVGSCKTNSSPGNWRALVKTPGFERMRINAGHFGGYHEPGTPGDPWSREFVGLMRDAPHFYADVGNWDKLATVDPAIVGKLAGLIQADIGGGATAARRILFGSDWYMLAKQKIWPAYADRVHQQLKAAGINGADLERVMYQNVLQLYGLSQATPGRNRDRLLDYYRRNDISPAWSSLS